MIKNISAAINRLSEELDTISPLPFAGSEILTLEFLVYTLRHYAPMEFDEYIEVLLEEVRSKRPQEAEKINHYRNQLSDVIELNVFT
jgi:hypothetical protein